MKKLLLLVFMSLWVLSLYAQYNFDYSNLTDEQIEFLLNDSIRGRKGRVSIPTYHTYMEVPEGLLYLAKNEANYLLENYWGNNHDNSILGVIVNKNAGIYANVEIAYVITYEKAGYVSDKDASSIDYDYLLESLRQTTQENNKIYGRDWELRGWAETPFYNKNQKVLYWARQFHSEKENNDWINYDIRILGKEGFMVIQAIADLGALLEVKAEVKDIIQFIKYDEGYAYSDFNPKTDHVAEWTIGGLVAGKMLAKAGILAKLGVFIAKGWKLIVLAIIAIGGFLTKIFRKNNT